MDNCYPYYTASGACSTAGEILTSSSGNISSPGYKADGTGAYGHNADCRWTIEAPQENVSDQIKTIKARQNL